MGAVKDALYAFGRFFAPIGSVLRLVARWVLAPALQFAFMLAAITLAYQIAATEMQAEQLAWEVLSSRNSGGHLGKAAALEHLNTDSTWPVPNVPGWFGYELERRDGASFSLNEGGWLRFPIPPLFRGRTDLRGLSLSHNVINAESCPDDSTVLAGLRLQHARLVEADFRCVNFEGMTYSDSWFVGIDSKQNGADFSEAQLHRAQFSGAKLKFAKFNNAMLFNSDFEHASVFGAQFNGARAVRARMLNLSVEHGNTDLSADVGNGANTSGTTGPAASAPLSSGSLNKSKSVVRSQTFCSQDICFIAACVDRSVLQFKPPQRGVVAVAFRGASLQHASLIGQLISADFGPLTADDRFAIESKRFRVCEPKQRLDTDSGNQRPLGADSPKRRDGNVVGADLTGADLQFTDWAESDFTGSLLVGTQLAGANLRFARGLTAAMLMSACKDEYTLLPIYDYTTPKSPTLFKNVTLIPSPCDRPPSDVVAGIDKSTDCKVESSSFPIGFRGSIEQMKNEILFIRVAGCENLVRFRDVSLTRTFSSIGAQGIESRARAARDLASKLAGRNLNVKCVRFRKPQPVYSTKDTEAPDPASREEFQHQPEQPRLNPVLEGWCAASLDKAEWVSLIEAIRTLPRADSSASSSSSSAESPGE